MQMVITVRPLDMRRLWPVHVHHMRTRFSEMSMQLGAGLDVYYGSSRIASVIYRTA